jgi:PleD family two-component response regulator
VPVASVAANVKYVETRCRASAFGTSFATLCGVMTSALDRGKPVLIVLADPPLAAPVRRVIGDAGFRPCVATDANEACELLGQGLDPCVVLFALDGSDQGREFLARHTADARTAEIPVIFFTPLAAQNAAPIAAVVAALVAFVQTHCDESSRDGASIVH